MEVNFSKFSIFILKKKLVQFLVIVVIEGKSEDIQEL